MKNKKILREKVAPISSNDYPAKNCDVSNPFIHRRYVSRKNTSIVVSKRPVFAWVCLDTVTVILLIPKTNTNTRNDARTKAIALG